MYSMILNRFYSMKLFQKICSSVIFQQKSEFANYEHKMSDCVSIFFKKWENLVFIGFFGQFYTNHRVKYFMLPKNIIFDKLSNTKIHEFAFILPRHTHFIHSCLTPSPRCESIIVKGPTNNLT